MLARTETPRCVECGKPFDAQGFVYHHGRIGNGPAYWSDRGILCSPECSVSHYRSRAAAGTLPSAPAPNPMPALGPEEDEF